MSTRHHYTARLPHVKAFSLLLCIFFLGGDRPSPRIFDVGVMHGTAIDVARAINNPIVELNQRRDAKLQAVERQKQFIASTSKSIIGSVHSTAAYKAIEKEHAQMKAEVELLRSDPNSPLEKRMQAGSRMNRMAQLMQQMERDELRRSTILAKAHADLKALEKELAESLPRIEDELRKAMKYREEMISAMRNSFSLRFTGVHPGSVGILGVVKPVEILGDDSFVCDYKSYVGLKREGRITDGIIEYEGIVRMNLLVVRGIPTKKMKVGEEIVLDMEVQVVDTARELFGRGGYGLSRGEPYIVAKTPQSDVDELFAAINDFAVNTKSSILAGPE